MNQDWSRTSKARPHGPACTPRAHLLHLSTPRPPDHGGGVGGPSRVRQLCKVTVMEGNRLGIHDSHCQRREWSAPFLAWPVPLTPQMVFPVCSPRPTVHPPPPRDLDLQACTTGLPGWLALARLSQQEAGRRARLGYFLGSLQHTPPSSSTQFPSIWGHNFPSVTSAHERLSI